MGFDPNPILKEAGIPPTVTLNPFARVPIENELQMWRLLETHFLKPEFTLKMAESVPFGTYPLLEYIGASCQSVHQALVFFQKYAQLVYGGWHPRLSEQGAHIQFSLGAEGEPEISRHTNVFGLALLYRRLNEFAEMKLPLAQVCFRHSAPQNTAAYVEFFEAPVLFHQSEDSLRFDAQIQQIPCRRSDRFLLGSLLDLAEKILLKLQSPSSASKLISDIETAIEHHLDGKEPELAVVAKDLAMSERTLQRKLTAEQTSFTELVTRVRMRKAADLLVGEKVSNEDVAFALGYSTLSAFDRAFKNFYKMTPTEFRKSKLKA